MSLFKEIETIFVLDGFVSSIYFFHYLLDIIKFSEFNNIIAIINDKHLETFFDKYNKIYKLDTLNKFSLYLFISVFSYLILCLSSIFINISNSRLILYLFVMPYIQNELVNIYHNRITEYTEKRNLFFQYLGSLLLCKIFFKELNYSIKEIIKNIVPIISWSFFTKFLKKYVFVVPLYYLRNDQTTYYIYKTVKTTYYIKTNYIFKAITEKDAYQYMEKFRTNFSSIRHDYSLNFVNAIYILKKDKRFSLYFFKYLVVKFLTIWSIIMFMIFLKSEIMKSNLKTELFTISLAYLSIVFLISRNYMVIIKNITIIFLIFLNIKNHLLLTILYYFYEAFYILIKELKYFI